MLTLAIAWSAWVAAFAADAFSESRSVEQDLYFETTVASEQAYLQDVRALLRAQAQLPTTSILAFQEEPTNPSTHLTVLHFAFPEDVEGFIERSNAKGSPENRLMDLIAANPVNASGQTSVIRSLYSTAWVSGQRMSVHAFTLSPDGEKSYIAAFDLAESHHAAAGIVPDQFRLMATGAQGPSVTHYTLVLMGKDRASEPLMKARQDSAAGVRFREQTAALVTTRLVRELTVIDVIH